MHVCNACNFEVIITDLVSFQSWVRVVIKVRIQEAQGSVVWIGACVLSFCNLGTDVCIVASGDFREVLGH